MELVKTENLVKKYPAGRTEFTALKDINLSVEQGEFCGVVGPSGSGKTTLLNIIGSLDVPTQGRALVIGKNISDLTHKQAALLRSREMGFIFQTYNLFPVYTVFENVEFFGKIRLAHYQVIRPPQDAKGEEYPEFRELYV